MGHGRKGRSGFAVTDSGVERVLTDRLPLWMPGGNVQQFTALFGRLHFTPLNVAGAQVTYETGGVDRAGGSSPGPTGRRKPHGGLPAGSRRAPGPSGARRARDGGGLHWLDLAGGPGSPATPRPADPPRPGGTYEPIELRVDAQIDRGRNTLFLHSHTELTTKEKLTESLCVAMPRSVVARWVGHGEGEASAVGGNG